MQLIFALLLSMSQSAAPSSLIATKKCTPNRTGHYMIGRSIAYWRCSAKGSLLYVRRRLSMRFHGKQEFWYPSGKRRCVIQYQNGKRHGVGQCWHPNGTPKHIQYHNDGKGRKTWFGWHANKRKWYKMTFDANGKTGTWQEWYANGKVKRIESWRRNKAHGTLSHYRANGQPIAVEQYKNGLRNGRSTWWHANGKKARTLRYRKGHKCGIEWRWSHNKIRRQRRKHNSCRDAHRKKPKTLLVLFDTSGSMNGSPIMMAQKTLRYIIKRLPLKTKLQVILFSEKASPLTAMTTLTTKTKQQLSHAVANISPKGKTNLHNALHAAYTSLKQMNSKRSFVLLMTDGQGPIENLRGLVHRMTKDNITLSTIALGHSASKSLLQELAKWGKGRSYNTLQTKGVVNLCKAELHAMGIPTRQTTSQIIPEKLPH